MLPAPLPLLLTVAAPLQRDARSILLFSTLTVVDEVNRSARRCRVNTHLGLTYLSFLEALCRLAASHGCPPGLPLVVLASDAAAAAAAASPKKPQSATKKRRGSAGTGGTGAGQQPPSLEQPEEVKGGTLASDAAVPPEGKRATSPGPRQSSRGAARLNSPTNRGRVETAPADGTTFNPYGPDEVPIAPMDLPSRLELLLCHIGIVENYNIMRARRPVPKEADDVVPP